MTLNVTSMIDIFTIILVFLLKSYSAEGHLIQIAESISLPISESQEEIHPAVSVGFNGDSLYVDGKLLIDDIVPYIESDEMLIEPLYVVLSESASRLQAVAEINEAVDFTGEIILQGDRKVPFRLLKKIIYTAGEAQYVNQSLAVFKE
jgi:biopolymer transport protein ExbD